MVLLDSSKPESITMLVFPTIALYNVIELNFIIFGTFKRRSGLYFWSFLVATWGIVPQAVAALTETFVHFVGVGLATMYILGWYAMVTGQSLVLYSRLHLIVHNPTILRGVLIMIIINSIVCHVPPTILAYGKDAGLTSFQGPYAIYEKIQVTLFFIQEVVISAIYIHEALKLMRARRPIDDNRTDRGRNLLIHLFVVNVLIVLLDINILAMEYAGLHNVQTSVKTFVYSAKLKIEFSILNKLVELTKRNLIFSEDEQTPVNRVLMIPEEVGVDVEKEELGGELGNSIYGGPETGNGMDLVTKEDKGGVPSVVMSREVTDEGKGSGSVGKGSEGRLEA